MAAAALLAAACTVGGDSEADYQSALLAEGTPAPDFVIRTDSCPDGFTLSSLQGSWVMLEFWASWCPDCQRATPTLKNIHDKYAPSGLVCVGISLDNDENQWREYISDNGMDWIHHRETADWNNSAVASAYNVRWLPTLYLITPDGKISFATIYPDDMYEWLGTYFSSRISLP